MRETVLELALAVSGGEAQARPLLEALCQAAIEAWTARLGEGVSVEDCGAAFSCAAAFTAAADLTGGQGEDAVSFTAGALSIREVGAAERIARAERLQRTAERLMAPYTVERGFTFQGVRG